MQLRPEEAAPEPAATTPAGARPGGPRRRLQALVTSRRWEIAIAILITLNAAALGLETSATAMARFGPVLKALDAAVLWLFVAEIVLRIAAFRVRFFLDPWGLFDFVIVAVALIATSPALAVLRVLRVLRILRLISVVPSLRRVVGGLIAALPGMGSIVLLMAILFYVFSVMATMLFGAAFPDWFGTLGASAYTLFQIMTLESWSMGIVRPVMALYPWAWVFFVPFILTTAFTVLNLFIGVIVSAMQEEVELSASEARDRLHDDQTALLVEVKRLRREIAQLRDAVERRP